MYAYVNDEYGFIDKYRYAINQICGMSSNYLGGDYWQNKGCCSAFDSDPDHFFDPNWLDAEGNLVERFNPVYNQFKNPTAYLNFDAQTRLFNTGQYFDYYRGLYELE